jgi:hypothetical protein
MEEISKAGNIHNVNDFLDFKLSIKTIIIIFCVWLVICAIVIIYMVGGISNAVEYITNIVDYLIKGKEIPAINSKNETALAKEPTEPSAANK